MSVRFKFRSSANFDSVDIGSLPSISVRDLKSKIVQTKKLNICHDFDLVFSDASTGQEYFDEDLQIPRGSSVIIKRVPGGTVPFNMLHPGSSGKLATINANMIKDTLPLNVETVDFDDFGAEICPVPRANLSGTEPDIDKKYCICDEKTNIKNGRCTELPMVDCQKLEGSDLSDSIPLGHIGFADNASDMKLKHNFELNTTLLKEVNARSSAMQNGAFPSELKCSLCNILFKDAVMIPCCQHSFCEKCIRQVLVEKGRCPKCFSAKCRVEDLLPNVALRQAIERFLESQILMGGSENAFHYDAPDGASGIQANDVPYSNSILQRQPELPPSPSATGRGSNQVAVESGVGTGSHAKHFGEDKILNMPFLLCKRQKIGENHGTAPHVNLKTGAENVEDFADFQGESQAIQEEAESNITKKRALWVNVADVENGFMWPGRPKKGDRTCYMCGSPGHLKRDCPAAFSPSPMLHRGNAMFPGMIPGYVSPYWNGPSFPHVNTFANTYSGGMMPFNSTMVPTTPFPVPTYMPSFFGGSPVYGGLTRMGSMTPVKNSIAHHLCRSELDVQDCEKRKFSSENVTRDRSLSYSEDSFAERSHRKHKHQNYADDDIYSGDERDEKSSRSSFAGQDRRPCHRSERSRSEVEDLPSSSSCYSEERHKHCHRSSKKQHNDRREQCGSDSSWSHQPANKGRDVKRKRVRHDIERHREKHHSGAESDLEPCHSDKHGKKQSQKDSSRSSRHSGHGAKLGNNGSLEDRWRMVGGSDENIVEDYHCYKRKKV